VLKGDLFLMIKGWTSTTDTVDQAVLTRYGLAAGRRMIDVVPTLYCARNFQDGLVAGQRR
jgi:hypothetical protein